MYSDATTEALSRLITMQPFFATYMYQMMEITETEAVPTAATDGVRILINPKFFADLNPQEREFVLAHEVLHGIYEHMSRAKLYRQMSLGPDMKPFSPKRWNHAGDYVINDVLAKSNVGAMPVGALYNSQFTMDDLVDDVYSALPPEEENEDDGFDEHLEPEGDGPSSDEVRSAISQAKNAAKAMGSMPSALDRIIGEILEPSVSWQEILQSMITASAGKDQATWARPNRRRIATPPHVYFPGNTGFQMGKVAIVIDTSGSISDNELSQFMGEVSSILDECRPEKVYVLWTDTEVSHVDEVEDAAELVNLQPHGGGGTNMPASFDYMDDHNIIPDQCIVFTDGYTPWGSEPAYDVIWAITTGKEAPYGRSVHVEIS